MKKYINYLAVLALVVFATGCFEDPGTDELITENSSGFVEIQEATEGSDSRLFLVEQDGNPVQAEITLLFGGGVSDTDVQITWEFVSDESTAIEGVDFDFVTGNTVTIPAGSYAVPIVMDINDDILNPDNPAKTITVRIASSSEEILEEGRQHTMAFNGVCPFDYANEVAGTYTATSSGESTDGNPDTNPSVSDLVLSGVTFEVNEDLTTADISAYDVDAVFGGIYEAWYCASYGYCFNTGGTILIDNSTGQISANLASAFGGDEFAASGVVDACAGGIITLNWTNAFGDTATTTFVKE